MCIGKPEAKQPVYAYLKCTMQNATLETLDSAA